MEAGKLAFGALLLILGVVVINLLAYAAVRGWARSGSPLEWKFGSPPPAQKKENALEELRRRVESLEKESKEK